MLCYREATKIFRSMEGPDSDVAAVLCGNGQLHAGRGEVDEALFCLGEALRISRLNPASAEADHFRNPTTGIMMIEGDLVNHVAELLQVIGNLLLERGDGADAMSVFSEAPR